MITAWNSPRRSSLRPSMSSCLPSCFMRSAPLRHAGSGRGWGWNGEVEICTAWPGRDGIQVWHQGGPPSVRDVERGLGALDEPALDLRPPEPRATLRPKVRDRHGQPTARLEIKYDELMLAVIRNHADIPAHDPVGLRRDPTLLEEPHHFREPEEVPVRERPRLVKVLVGAEPRHPEPGIVEGVVVRGKEVLEVHDDCAAELSLDNFPKEMLFSTGSTADIELEPAEIAERRINGDGNPWKGVGPDGLLDAALSRKRGHDSDLQYQRERQNAHDKDRGKGILLRHRPLVPGCATPAERGAACTP